MMAERSEDQRIALEHLSAMMDGEGESSAVSRLCVAWHADMQMRASWHAYHLIGDVLRSDDLSSAASHDIAFLQAVRERLAAEPVVMAPAALGVAREETDAAAQAVAGGAPLRETRRNAWSVPVALAAGFVAVAGTLLVLQTPTQMSPGQTLASAPRSEIGQATATAEPAAEPRTVVADGKIIRDARLDQYLAAHKQFGGSSALGVPSGFLRSATVDVPQR
jgi:sigma-E factor negative regulatory protein RseA